jgi:hypothetical protein
MTRQTGDGGPEEEKGEYVVHGTLGGTMSVMANLKKMGRKGLTIQPGHFTQLGGEFVFGPRLQTHYGEETVLRSNPLPRVRLKL